MLQILKRRWFGMLFAALSLLLCGSATLLLMQAKKREITPAKYELVKDCETLEAVLVILGREPDSMLLDAPADLDFHGSRRNKKPRTATAYVWREGGRTISVYLGDQGQVTQSCYSDNEEPTFLEKITHWLKTCLLGEV